MSQLNTGNLQVPPLSMADVTAIGEAWLAKVLPEQLVAPRPLVGLTLLRHVEQQGIPVLPVESSEMCGQEALTTLDHPVQIWMEEDFYDLLRDDGAMGRRSRVTLAHELGHALIHAPYVQRMYNTLHRSRNLASLEAHSDAEWQAFAFAGCVLMPVSVIRKYRSDLSQNGSVSADLLAETFNVSFAFAQNHLKRIRRLGL